MDVKEPIQSEGSSIPSFDATKEVKVNSQELNTVERASGGFDTLSTKKLMRKIDYNLIPLLALLYLLSFLDRTNIGNARLAGLESSLGMNPQSLDYNIAISVFFPFYVAAEIPSNLAMKRFRPSIWIPFIMVLWGVTCAAMGTVTNYAGLIAARCALGIAEAGLFPGIAYYITLWYKRHECGLRMAIFFSAATAAGAFGGLLARGIVEMDGVGGRRGWAWIFILEGILTIIVAIVAFFIMNDYPDTAKFLKAEEKIEVLRRLEEDRSSLSDEFDMRYFWHALKDWKIWVHMFISIGISIPLYSFSIFLPTIVKNLGYTNDKTAQLMTVPPFIAACICCIGSGWLADRHGQRGIYMIFFNLVAILGFIFQICSSNNRLKYAGTFLAAMGMFPNIPQSVAWNGNNIGGSTKRGVGIAMHVGFGNLSGAIAGFMYRTKDAPMFYSGHGTLIATETMSLILCIFMTLYLRKENARRDREYKPPSEYTDEERALEREKGDNASFFRYTV
ncbi:putative nicotinamide mononucleotide transmembrane transporter protein [Pseudomassariella vexata]|uniref:Putative nicotinamide mononucleotide transmembrane transporter protein n=1 Tax=Pseudomassariella vexata TaxID=1141098 RepID=A0A1Y2DMY5_9PEZI|nr:putative nicotinamide mononucleotide transmembrane transporter protein [Pseudomassariella vexata]ORY60005.1 putative nicotinamide mononucleotide transmembrane transporter protein [Pseudomassariella vexata]